MIRETEDRLERLRSLKKHNLNPYPDNPARTHLVSQVLEHFDKHEKNEKALIVAGRVMALRDIGALTFLRVMDDSGTIQVVLQKKDLGDAYRLFLDHADVGDLIEATGRAFTTKTGEKSVLVSSIRILAKALQPLPEKWHGLTDVEARYRHRELDLLSNTEVKERFVMRSRVISRLRSFLDSAGFLEVETPILQQIPGGANARPFVTHHNALGADLYLRIAPELYLKRLIVGGFEKIYEIGRCFRNEGIDYSHNPEFTMLELYWAYATKDEFIAFLEALLMHIAPMLQAPWKRMTFRDAILDVCGIDINTLKDEAAVVKAAKAKKLKIDFSKCIGFGEHLDELWKKTARPHLQGPVWIFDYPVELKPLAKTHPEDPTKSATVQLVMSGEEVVNAYYHELNDPLIQRERLLEQERLREEGSEEAQHIDQAFLDALEHGMPPTSGVGIGIDRLVAFLTNAQNLKEVILFPTLKPEKEE